MKNITTKNAVAFLAIAGTLGLAACSEDAKVANTNAAKNAPSNVAVVTNTNNTNGVANTNSVRDVDYTTPDGLITAKTQLAFMASTEVASREVDVDTVGGVVTLSGKVEKAEAKAAAEKIAKAISGVTSVKNELQVVPEAGDHAVEEKDEAIQSNVNNYLDNDAAVKALGLKGKVNAGVVTLNGNVGDYGTLTKAATAVRKINGVKRVVTSAVKIEAGAATAAGAAAPAAPANANAKK